MSISFKEFNLSPSIMKAIDKCGYDKPTPVQEQAIPKAISGHDIIATAQTGTGKTAAFTIPALERISASAPLRKGRPKVLVLAPTRELADQVKEATRTYGLYMGVKCTVILGGVPYGGQMKALSKPVDIIVATPGRLLDHINRGTINLENLELLILDEADRMLDMGFKEDVEKIAAATPKERQTMLFTATIDNSMIKLASKLLKKPERIKIDPKKNSELNIEQRLHVTDNMDHKSRLLMHLLSEKNLRKAIVFSATKKDTDLLARQIMSGGHKASALHGDMNQSARNRAISRFRKGAIKILVATDVAARGIDINDISHVINFDIPKYPEDYVHRIGRTGRAGASGIAISFVSHGDIVFLRRIENYIGKALPQHVVEGLEPLRPLSSSQRPRNGKGRSNTGGNFRRSSGGDTGRGYGKEKKWGQTRTKRKVEVIYAKKKSSSQPARNY